MSRLLRRALDLCTIPGDWLAFRLVMALPSHWPPVEPVWFRLLPYAGCWAYRNDPFVAADRAHWIATGEHLTVEHLP